MNCARVAEKLGETALDPVEAARAAGHAAVCDDCAALLRRAREVASLIGSRSEEDPPAGLRDRVRCAAFGLRQTSSLLRVARVAAAVLLLAAGGLAVFGILDKGGSDGAGSARDYEPLEVRVVKVQGSGGLADTFALEGVYGPDAALVALGEGGSFNENGR